MEFGSFRLASVLYANSDYDVTAKTVVRKTVETVFVQKKNVKLNQAEIVEYCHTYFGLIFDIGEIRDAIERSEHFYFEVCNDGFTAQLTDKRFTHLANTEYKDVVYFIDLFLGSCKIETNRDNTYIKDLLCRFLYNTLNSHTSTFERLICRKSNRIDIPAATVDYVADDRVIVDSFLEWNNPEKDKAIYDLLCAAMEYCLISGKKSSHREIQKGLSHKCLFIDTNIIFRGLGIHGENRKNLIVSFLRKCLSHDQEIRISSFTDIEFRNTIDAQLKSLNRFHGIHISPSLVKKFSTNDDIYAVFNEWRRDNSTLGIEYFKSFIFSKYDQFRRDFGISIDNKTSKLINSNDEQEIRNIAGEIARFRRKENGFATERDFHDATLSLLVNRLRADNCRNITDTKYFVISTDQEFGKWNGLKSDSICSLILLPSHWLTLLLKYGTRSEDDYKSFTKFIELRKASSAIDNSKLEVVFACVCQISNSIETQEFLVSNLLDSDFKNKLIATRSDNDAINLIFEFSEHALNQQLEEHKHKIATLEEQNALVMKEQSNLQEKVTVLSSVLSQNQNQASPSEELKLELLRRDKRDKIVIGIFLILLAVFLLLFLLFEFICTGCQYNIAFGFRNLIESNPSEVFRGTFINLNYGLFGASSVGVGYLGINKVYEALLIKT